MLHVTVLTWWHSLACLEPDNAWVIERSSLEMHIQNYCLVVQSCLTLCDSMDCSTPGSTVHGILQARILEWVALSSSRGFSQPRDQPVVSCAPTWAGRFFTTGPPGKPVPYLLLFGDSFWNKVVRSWTNVQEQRRRMRWALKVFTEQALTWPVSLGFSKEDSLVSSLSLLHSLLDSRKHLHWCGNSQWKQFRPLPMAAAEGWPFEDKAGYACPLRCCPHILQSGRWSNLFQLKYRVTAGERGPCGFLI